MIEEGPLFQFYNVGGECDLTLTRTHLPFQPPRMASMVLLLRASLRVFRSLSEFCIAHMRYHHRIADLCTHSFTADVHPLGFRSANR